MVNGVPLPLSKAMEGMEVIQNSVMSDQVATKLFAISCKVRSQEGRYTHLHIPLCKVRHTNITSCSRIFWESFFQKITLILVNSHLKKKKYIFENFLFFIFFCQKKLDKNKGGTLSDILQVLQIDV